MTGGLTPTTAARKSARYDFGRNWSELAARFDERHVVEAATDLARLAGNLEGRTFLDLGCGSGLHSAAAHRLGAKKVVAIDFDRECVNTTRAVLERFAPGKAWAVAQADATDRASLPAERFDVVYSWGVLHHTGHLWQAVRNTADLVGPAGSFCVALYLKTPFCGAWRLEKRLYSSQSWLRPPVKALFSAAYLLARAVRHRDVVSYVREYRRRRGMEFSADIDDWLGGYPYESVIPAELEAFVGALGFGLVDRFNTSPGLGIFGTGCGEWRFARIS